MGYNNNNRKNFDYGKTKKNNNEVKVPEAIKVTGFYNSDGSIKSDLFDSFAIKVAESWIGEKDGKPIGVTSSQLRRVYDEVKRFELLLVPGSNQWEKQIAYIKMIKSKAAYTLTRAGLKDGQLKGVYNNLYIFISSSIDLIRKEEDFKIFSSLFEAAYGYYYQMANKKNIKDVKE